MMKDSTGMDSIRTVGMKKVTIGRGLVKMGMTGKGMMLSALIGKGCQE